VKVDTAGVGFSKTACYKWAGGILITIVLAGIPLVIEKPFATHVLIMILMYASLGQSWNIISGYAGQVSLGHAVFFGAGAYTSSVLLIKLGITPWAGMIGGILVSLIIAVVIGAICFKLKGHYFVIATLVIAEIVLIVVSNMQFLGGAAGIWIPVLPASILNLEFHASKVPYYYIFLLFTALTFALTWWLERSRTGYYFQAIKADPDAAQALAINIARYKMIALAISSALAAIQGTLYAQYVLIVDPYSVLVLKMSLMMALVTVLGGAGTLWGPLVGSAILIPISEYSRSWLSGGGKALDLMIYGALIIAFAVYQPNGIMGLWDRFRRGKKPAVNRCRSEELKVVNGHNTAGK